MFTLTARAQPASIFGERGKLPTNNARDFPNSNRPLRTSISTAQ
jgi:hypothetical protein